MKKTCFVFFDTEFTSLATNMMRGLISIGCVAQTGETFYAELSDTWDDNLCSFFVIGTVLPLLEGGDCVMGVETLAARLKDWIEGLTDKQVVFMSDSTMDFTFIKEIFDFHGWPKNLRRTHAGLMFEDMRQMHKYNVGKYSYWKQHQARQHHALVDAQGLAFAWKYATKKPAGTY